MIEGIRKLVRPAVTLIVVGVFAYLSIRGVIKPETFMGIVGTIVGFWFGSRAKEVVK